MTAAAKPLALFEFEETEEAYLLTVAAEGGQPLVLEVTPHQMDAIIDALNEVLGGDEDFEDDDSNSSSMAERNCSKISAARSSGKGSASGSAWGGDAPRIRPATAPPCTSSSSSPASRPASSWAMRGGRSSRSMRFMASRNYRAGAGDTSPAPP